MVVACIPEPCEHVPGCVTVLFYENLVSVEISGGSKSTLKDPLISIRMFPRSDRKGESVSIVDRATSCKNNFQFENVDVEEISRPELNVIIVNLIEEDHVHKLKRQSDKKKKKESFSEEFDKQQDSWAMENEKLH